MNILRFWTTQLLIYYRFLYLYYGFLQHSWSYDPPQTDHFFLQHQHKADIIPSVESKIRVLIWCISIKAELSMNTLFLTSYFRSLESRVRFSSFGEKPGSLETFRRNLSSSSDSFESIVILCPACKESPLYCAFLSPLMPTWRNINGRSLNGWRKNVLLVRRPREAQSEAGRRHINKL